MRVFIQRRVLRGLVATDRVEDALFIRKCENLFANTKKKEMFTNTSIFSRCLPKNEEEDENEEENDTRTKLKSIQADRQRAYAEFGFLEIEFTNRFTNICTCSDSSVKR